MRKDPTISFVIPVYKKPPEVFGKCLDSLFDMSFRDIEVICVFDGSDSRLEEEVDNRTGEWPVTRNKNTGEADPETGLPIYPYRDNSKMEDRSHQLKKVVIEHGGAPKARNKGLELATGKYVVFWDADCYAKPEMAARWIQEFEAVPDADFVYTGYEITQERGGMPGEPFDPYSLTCGNYICSMSPIKREKALQWDETLEAGQDWDYWLTAVEKGYKGVWIEGAGFITDAPEIGISSKHWSAENREETIRKIRAKHGIPDREIGVYSQNYTPKALKIAEVLGADLIKSTGKDPRKYKLILNLGYSYMSRFDEIPESVTKIQYWLPAEIEALKNAQYRAVMETIRIAKTVTNFCNTPFEKNQLAELGINADVVPLPVLEKDSEKVQRELPDKFKVLLVTDESYGKLLKELEIDLPHIQFVSGIAQAKDFSCLLSFYQFAALDEAILMAQINGRHVISNVQAPFCGFIDPDQTWDAFKKELYEAIRVARGKSFNKEGQDYYLDLANPQRFRDAINGRLPKIQLEVA